MATVFQPKHPALRDVYWREEILEVVQWLRGEGYDEHLDADVLARFLGLAYDEAHAHLERLTAQAYLHRLTDGRFALTATGEEETQRVVAAHRAVPEPAPGRCGAGCWCATSPIEAAACADQRLQ